MKSWCRICGKEYDVCPTCAEIKVYKPYRMYFCGETHYKVWMTLKQYKEGIIDPSTAKEQLTELRLSAKDVLAFIPSVKELYKGIKSPKKYASVEEEDAKVDETNTDVCADEANA